MSEVPLYPCSATRYPRVANTMLCQHSGLSRALGAVCRRRTTAGPWLCSHRDIWVTRTQNCRTRSGFEAIVSLMCGLGG